MSRPDSPLRSNLTDEETFKKLKAMVIKEKRLNKENSKLIADLTADIEGKRKENDQLISQIHRLSENIGLLEENNTTNSELIYCQKNEIQSLNIKLNDIQLTISEKDEELMKTHKQLNSIYEKLQMPVGIYDKYKFDDIIIKLESNLESCKMIEAENYKLNEQVLQMSQLQEKSNGVKSKLCQNINDILSVNKLASKIVLKEDDEFDKISYDIINSIRDLMSKLNNQIESNNLLQDGFDKLVYKCSDLESTIQTQSDKLESLAGVNDRVNALQTDLDQKKNQIKRLEALIEDNRNISRALEIERDQLQNDFVDLRQRHEEKEGYLMEEYREAKQNLESYRNSNDKDSASQIREIDQLRQLVTQYQQEQIKTECNTCRPLIDFLKKKFNLDSYQGPEEVFDKIIDHIAQINLFQVNEIEAVVNANNENTMSNSTDNSYIQDITTDHPFIIENVENSIETEKTPQIVLDQESFRFNQTIDEIRNILEIDDTTDQVFVIDRVRNLKEKYEQNIEIMKQIEEVKQMLDNEKSEKIFINRDLSEKIENLLQKNIDNEKIINSLKDDIEEKKKIISQFEDSQCQLMEESNILSEILPVDSTTGKTSVIDRLKQFVELNAEMSRRIEQLNQMTLDDKKLIESLNTDLEARMAAMEERDCQVLELKETQFILSKDIENFNKIIQEISSIFQLDKNTDQLFVMDHIRQYVSKMREIEQLNIETLQQASITDNNILDTLNKEIVEKTETIEKYNCKIAEIEESRLNLMKEKNNLSEIFQEISSILQIDNTTDNTFVVDQLKSIFVKKEEIINENKELLTEIEKLKQSIEKESMTLRETEEKLGEFEQKNINHKALIDSLELDKSKLSDEKNDLSKIFDEISAFCHFDKTTEKLLIIDHVKNIFENLQQKSNENKHLINQIKQLKHSMEQDITEKLTINEMTDNLKKIEQMSINDKKLMDSLKNDIDEKIRNIQEIENSHSKLLEEKNDLSEVIEEISSILQINNTADKTFFINQVKNIFEKKEDIMNENKQLMDEIEQFKQLIKKESVENSLRNRDTEEKLREFEQKIKMLSDIEESSNLWREIIEEIGKILKLDNITDKAFVIDRIKQLSEDSSSSYQEKDDEINQLKQNMELLRDDIEQRIAIMDKNNCQIIELEDMRSKLSNENKNLTVIVEDLTRKLEEKCSDLTMHQEKSQLLLLEIDGLKEQISRIEEHSTGNDLMSLEMAEFDKTLINLNNQLATKTGLIEELETDLRSKSSQIQLLQEQLVDRDKHNAFLEERSHKMKQLLVKTKRELADCKVELEQLKLSNGLNQDRLESLTGQLEENKCLLSEAIADKEKAADHHSMVFKKLETISKNKDIRLVEMRSQLDSAMHNHQLLQSEFESYKIKAQNALYSNRPKSTFSNFMTTESAQTKLDGGDHDKKDMQRQITNLEGSIKDLKLEAQESEDKIFSLTHELDTLRWENDRLMDKNKTLAKENNEINLKLQQIIQDSQEIDKIQKNSYSSLIERFELEKENLASKYLNQMEKTQSHYESEISNLEKRLIDVENEKIKYQEEIWSCREQLKTSEQKLSGINFSTDNGNGKYPSWPSANFKNPLEHERQQGEGMETSSEHDHIDSVPNQRFSPKIVMANRSYSNTLVPLDKLISSVDDESNHLLEEQLALAISQSQASKKKIEHLNELLNDSEATVARLTDQATILKSEIRRLEKNYNRDSKLTDEPTHEYLKNVIMKFLDCDTKLDERGHLVPVLVTLLSLDLSEKEKLLTFSKLIQFDKRQNGEGWSSYFNWTG